MEWRPPHIDWNPWSNRSAYLEGSPYAQMDPVSTGTQVQYMYIDAWLHVYMYIDACLHVYMYIDAWLHVYMYIDACLHVYMYIDAWLHVYMYIDAWLHVYMYIDAWLHVYMYIDACLHVYMYIDACLHVYMYIDAWLHVYIYMYGGTSLIQAHLDQKEVSLFGRCPDFRSCNVHKSECGVLFSEVSSFQCAYCLQNTLYISVCVPCPM